MTQRARNITVTYEATDGYRDRRSFKTLVGAQRYAQKWVGAHPEKSDLGYAVSGDGIGKVTVRGGTIEELFLPVTSSEVGTQPERAPWE